MNENIRREQLRHKGFTEEQIDNIIAKEKAFYEKEDTRPLEIREIDKLAHRVRVLEIVMFVIGCLWALGLFISFILASIR